MELSLHLGEMKIWGGRSQTLSGILSVGVTLGIHDWSTGREGSSWRKDLGVISEYIVFEVMSLDESLDETE